MKKIALVIAIVLGISGGMSAQTNGLFGYGEDSKGGEEDEFVTAWYALGNDQEVDNSLFGLMRDAYNMPNLPNHGENTNQDAPLGGGILLLVGFGTAYAMKKKKGTGD